MKTIFTLIIICNTFCVSVFSQGNEYPDSPYDRPGRSKYINDHPYIYTYCGNTALRVSDSLVKGSLLEVDSAWKKYKVLYDFEYPTIKNTVLFTPINFLYKNNEAKPACNFHLNDFVEKHDIYKYSNSSVLPNSLRMYVGAKDVIQLKNKLAFLLAEDYVAPIEKYVQPFYMSKFEVANIEYRTFVNYVRDSIMRLFLATKGDLNYGKMIGDDYILNWETPINTEDPILQQEFYKKGDVRFYKKKEFNISLLKYYCENSDSTILIYPDTLAWINNDTYYYNDPMAAMYFWHPAYDYYPVVGVSYYQALAFLEWKTKTEQGKLDAQGIGVSVSYTLPNDIEWDIAATATINENTKEIELYGLEYKTYSDKSWITDLQLSNSTIGVHDTIFNKKADTIIYTTYINYMVEDVSRKDMPALQPTSNMNLSYANMKYQSEHWSYYQRLKQKRKKTYLPYLKYADAMGISYMGANVSEWLLDSYKQQWKPIFDKRQEQLQSINTEESLLLSKVEQYYDKKNHEEGRLVRGGNWLDNRHESLNKGKNAKIFANPSQGYSTVGFRYVVHVEKK